MKRAAVLIGVDKTGGLPRLADAAAGAERMEAWALAQGMARRDVVLLTDRQGPVTLSAIADAIEALVARGSIEQLVVYFAGHGVMIRRGEYWLLSKAPERASEAVNVEGSVALARTCGIPHVVFISDACRTAAAGVQAQSVTGGEIFPNQTDAKPGKPVDWFFATTVGKPALELRSDGSADGDFRAVYTAALLDAVEGRIPGALAPGPADAKPAFVVRPWALLDTLTAELPKRIAALGFGSEVTQEPEARINSRPDAAWIAGFDADPRAAAGAAAGGAAAAPAPASAPGPMPMAAGADALSAESLRRDARTASARDRADAVAPPPFLRRSDASAPALRGARRPPAVGSGPGDGGAAGEPAAVRADATRPAVPAVPAVAAAPALVARRELAAAFREAVLHPFSAPTRAPPTAIFRRTRSAGGVPPPPPAPPPRPTRAAPFGPTSFETGRGFKLRGATVARATAAHLTVEVFDDDRSIVRVGGPDASPGLVLLELAENGTGVLLPALVDWIVAIDVVDGEIADVAWEPTESSARHADFVGRADELRALRAHVAEAAREGVFRLDAKTAAALAPRMQSAKSVDPGLGLYAAYAHHALQDDATLRHLAQALRDDLGIGLFDLDLLAGRIPASPADPSRLPPFPLLQQGWNLLGALGAPLPEALAPLRGELVDALWTQFTPAGAARLRGLLEKGSLP